MKNHIKIVIQITIAKIIDYAIFYAILKIIGYLLPFRFLLQYNVLKVAFLCQITVCLAITLYYTLAHMMFGSSAGKYFMYIRVVSANGLKLSFWQSFIRAFLCDGVRILLPFTALLSISSMYKPTRILVDGYCILNLAFFVFNIKNRCIHDYATSTTVIGFDNAVE